MTQSHELTEAALNDLSALEGDRKPFFIGHQRWVKMSDLIALARKGLAAEWRPISTAPKDGMPLLLYGRFIRATAPVRFIGWFLDEYGWINAQFGTGEPQQMIPTHWLPLPNPPTEERTEDGVLPNVAGNARKAKAGTPTPPSTDMAGEKCPCGSHPFAYNFEPGDGEITCAWCGRNMN